MQFQVPQFIETEDKIVGPLTLKQLGYVGPGALVIFFLYFVLDPLLWFLVAGIFTAIAVGLAFGKVNGRPMMSFVTAFMDSVWRPKVYVFRPPTAPSAADALTPEVAVKVTSRFWCPRNP